jgi:prophage antirepressor-like protein
LRKKTSRGERKMEKAKVWNYEDKTVRTIEKDGEMWWALSDVCRVLEIANTSQGSSRLDDDEKATICLTYTGKNGSAIPHKYIVVNESGLYNVILRSDKPQAKQFKRWVTHEVLPQIRKTGGYNTKNEQIEPPKGVALKYYEPKSKEQYAKIGSIIARMENFLGLACQCDMVLNTTMTYCDKYNKALEVFTNYLKYTIFFAEKLKEALPLHCEVKEKKLNLKDAAKHYLLEYDTSKAMFNVPTE